MSWKENIQLGASIATLPTVLFALYQLISFSQHTKSQRAYEMIDRFWSNCHRGMETMISIKMETPTSSCLQTPVFTNVSNFFEQLGDMWVSQDIDQNIIRKYLGGYINRSFEFFKPEILQYRKERYSDFCKQWEQMIFELENPEPKDFHEFLRRQQAKKGWF